MTFAYKVLFLKGCTQKYFQKKKTIHVSISLLWPRDISSLQGYLKFGK